MLAGCKQSVKIYAAFTRGGRLFRAFLQRLGYAGFIATTFEYHDFFTLLVIDLSLRGQDAAPARASVILALLRPETLERDGCAELLARLKVMQSGNPAARVLVAVAHGRRPLTAHQAGCVLVFVAQLPRARLADTLVLEDGQDTYHSRHSALEPQAYKQDHKLCAPEVRHLYREVFLALARRS